MRGRYAARLTGRCSWHGRANSTDIQAGTLEIAAELDNLLAAWNWFAAKMTWRP